MFWFREQCLLVHCRHRRTYYSVFTATTIPLGVALQHVAARKFGARSSVYVRVRKPVKNPLTGSQTEDESEKTIEDPDDDDV